MLDDLLTNVTSLQRISIARALLTDCRILLLGKTSLLGVHVAPRHTVEIVL